MRVSRSSTTVLWVVTPAVLAAAGFLTSYGSGTQPGSSGIPQNAARALPSCSNCHSNSFGGGPQVSLTASKYALQPNESITMTTATSGGVSGTTGGFIAEATAGTFTAMGNTRVVNNGVNVTHSDRNSRTWTYGYDAPNATGLVEIYSVAQTTNGGGTSGDKFAFAGFDPNETTPTPMRLFVLPQGVTATGTSCPDGFGNMSVLGANGVPGLGNTGFAVELHGATPNGLGFLIAGVNPPGFTPVDLGAVFGLTGCNGYVANPVATVTAPTGSGSAQRAEGSATFPIPIPARPSLQGLILDVQGAYVDPSAQSSLGRSLPFSFSNGLRLTVQ